MGNVCGTDARGVDAPADGPHKGGVAQPVIVSAVAQGHSSSGRRTHSACNSSRCSHESAGAEFEPLLRAAREELAASSRKQPFHKLYHTGKIVGHGAFAKVMVCTCFNTGEKLAVKTVAKDFENLHTQREGIAKEVAIMRRLQDHPACVKLLEVFEDHHHFHLVMELCTGGELFDQIIAKGHFTERDASAHMQALLEFLAFAHSCNIVHRDLKPENILLSDSSPEARLKVIDFGTSEFCRDGQKLQQKFGTPYYVAPEVLRQDYDKSADVWSCGVILYILLSGYPPFSGKCDSQILQKITIGTYSMAQSPWEVITGDAKHVVTHMLEMDPARRQTAKQLLQHRWFSSSASAEPAAALGNHMVNRLRLFASMSRLKRLALVVLARTLTDKDVARLRELFVAMDTDTDGRISAEDLHSALDKVGAAIDATEMTELFAASDLDGQGTILYDEFIAAMLDSNRVSKRKDAVRRSFEALDRDGDGFITPSDLIKCMPRGCSMDVARTMVQEVDNDHDGKVDYQEFERMMQS